MRNVCGGCREKPVRAPGQWYCQACQSAKDNASAKARRAELKALREECARLRELLRANGQT
jgi:hypothetical protein